MAAGVAAQHRPQGHGQRRRQHPELTVAPGGLPENFRPHQPPLPQQGLRQPQTKDAEQAHEQAHPAHGVDRLTKQAAGQQGHQQGLGINQDRAQASPRAPQAPRQQALKSRGIHDGEEGKPEPIAAIDHQGAAQGLGRE